MCLYSKSYISFIKKVSVQLNIIKVQLYGLLKCQNLNCSISHTNLYFKSEQCRSRPNTLDFTSRLVFSCEFKPLEGVSDV